MANEDDIFCIDATGAKFTQKRFNEFCSYVKDENEVVNIVINDIVKEVTFKELRSFFENEENAKMFQSHSGDICSFSCDAAALMVDVNDVCWWQKSIRDTPFGRIEKLFSEVKINSINDAPVAKEKVDKTSKTKQLIKVAAGIQSGVNIEELDLFEGSNKECAEFINKYNAKAKIRSSFKATTKFVVNYTNDDDLCISTNWKTIDELELEGVVSVI